MWISKLRKKKMQYFLLGIIFTIAILIISVSTVITIISGTFATKYYEGDSTPDIQVITTSDSVVKKSREWYELKNDKTRNYEEYDMYSVSTNLSFNDKANDSLTSYIVPIKDVKDLSNKMEVVKGDNKKAPMEGEIWVSSTTAKLKDINIDDKVKITDSNNKRLEYRVSAIVNDSNQSSASLGIVYVYVNELEKENLELLPSTKMITMNCDGDTSEMYKELVDYINEPIGLVLDKDTYILLTTMTGAMIGGIGLLSSIVLVVVLILILRSNIKNNILKEYKSIGIYKAIGYSSAKIRNIYLYGYGIVSMVSSFIGIALSVPIASYICNIAFENMGRYELDLSTLYVLIVVFLLFNLLVYINLHMVLKSVDKVKPVEAISIGLTSSKEKMKKSLIKNSSFSLSMAINDIFKYKKNNFIILIMFTLVFYMSTLFLNISYTMNILEDNLHELFGTPRSDLVVSAPSDIENSIKDIIKYLDKDDRVKDYYTWNTIDHKKISMDSSKYKVVGGTLMSTIYNKFNENDFSISQGFNPKNKNEISISLTMLQANNLKIGDYMTLNIEGKNREILIVGSYPSMMSGGQNIRLTSDIMSDKGYGNIAFINLKDIDDYGSLKNDINKKFGGISIDKIYPPLKDSVSQVIETSVPISTILLIGTLVFGIFNIINILIINNFDNRKNYGIMKSLGFTSRYIRWRSNYRILSLAILGGLIGVGLMGLTSNNLLKLVLGFDIFETSLTKTLGLIGIIFALIIITLHICNRSIKKISTVELIEE